ncbi:membrane protein [Salmonella enterica subsp. enterica]|uniref:Membrane protein n=1 Tax=Salmonella enterica I TaxID=59201 RepID=A0A447N2G4_SALET|nr:membrane protein [Salmonella enterica subsp. enterica]
MVGSGDSCGGGRDSLVDAAPAGIPEGFAASNGRIEATEVDIATKIAGRIDTILVSEGQFVRQGDGAGRKWIPACCRSSGWEAIAQIKGGRKRGLPPPVPCWSNARVKCAPRSPVVKQREAELDSVSKRHVRSRSLSQRGAVSVQQLDDDRAAAESARAALETAKAQVSAAKAAIEAARTSIIQAQTPRWKRRRRPSGAYCRRHRRQRIKSAARWTRCSTALRSRAKCYRLAAGC